MDTNKLMQIWIVPVYSCRAAAEPVKNGLFQGKNMNKYIKKAKLVCFFNINNGNQLRYYQCYYYYYYIQWSLHLKITNLLKCKIFHLLHCYYR